MVTQKHLNWYYNWYYNIDWYRNNEADMTLSKYHAHIIASWYLLS